MNDVRTLFLNNDPGFLEQIALIDEVFSLAKEQGLNDSSEAVAA